ncbi:hypothetical protein C8J57DRAFT_1515591 [Mycena rebaudengoi]|nr:hypothetical protein C8J57DRAFT_1515591 [Mycena rebaudengoi]
MTIICFNVTHASSDSHSPPKKPSHAALIGGVISGVVVLIIAAGLLLLYLRRRRRHKSGPSATSIMPLPALAPATMSESGPLFAVSSGKRHPSPNSGVSGTVPNSDPSPAQSSYGPSVSWTSQSQSHGSSPTADNTEHPSSIADLKRRQQQVVSSYKAGINGGNAHSAPIQHVDSGVRELTPAAAGSGSAELPPVYTAT